MTFYSSGLLHCNRPMCSPCLLAVFFKFSIVHLFCYAVQCTVYIPPPQTTPMGCITFIPLYTINPITFINTILGHPYYLEPCRPHNLEFTICHTIWNHAGLTTLNSLSIVLSGTRPHNLEFTIILSGIRPHNLEFTIYHTIWNQPPHLDIPCLT